ncbi:MAG: iron response transcriptional regulator IrrA [Pseudomonadota bacterium]
MSTTEPMISPKDGRSPEARASFWLSSAGLRPTRQRIALAELLVGDGHDRHVTAEILFDSVKASGASVSLATVYNTLRSFTEVGLVNEITLDGTRSYFDTNISDHAHFHFDDGRVMDATDGPVRLGSLPDVPEGYEIAKIDVVIRLRKKPDTV